MYRGSAKQHKLRVITNSDQFIITIPKKIAIEFKDTYFEITKSGTLLILESGCKK